MSRYKKTPTELQRFWLIVHKPGNVPERKGSWPITEQTQVLREFMKARPDSYLHIVTIDSDGAPDVQHGPEALQMADQRSLGTGRKHNARTQEAHAKAACICGSPYYDLGAHVSYCPVAVEQARALSPPTPAETVTVALPGAGEVEHKQYSHEDWVTALAVTLAAIATEAQEEHGEWTWREIATAALSILSQGGGK